MSIVTIDGIDITIYKESGSIFHEVALPDGRVITADFSRHTAFSTDTLKKWIALGYPDRFNLRVEDLIEEIDIELEWDKRNPPQLIF